MKCVFYDNKKPNGFEEKFAFSREVPYTIHIRKFLVDDIVPLHYAKTIEILFCDHLKGQISINREQYELGGQQLFIIPPYTVHSANMLICSGTLYELKISLEELDHYVNLSRILESSGCRIDQFAYTCPAYTEAFQFLFRMIQSDGCQFPCFSNLLSLFHLLSQHRDTHRISAEVNTESASAFLQELISWTQEHFSEKVTIEEAAKKTGYSKYYFCSRFKELTGITYLNYLNSVRFSHACLLLAGDQSVQEISNACGFDNVSYFIQAFKRFWHCTPGQFQERLHGQASSED